jgi:hypothetical protein
MQSIAAEDGEQAASRSGAGSSAAAKAADAEDFAGEQELAEDDGEDMPSAWAEGSRAARAQQQAAPAAAVASK